MKKPRHSAPKKETHHSKKHGHSPSHHAAHPKAAGGIEGMMFVIGKGGGVVRTEKYKDGIRVFEENMNTALHGDEVTVQIVRKRGEEIVGRIESVILRAKTEFTGVLMEDKSGFTLKASDPKMYARISIDKNQLAGAKAGDRVYVAMDEWTDASKQPRGRVIKMLGVPGEHETEMQAIALERGFMEDFPEDVVKEAKYIEARGIREEDLKGRRDFRKIVTFTIDPFDAKDFDDAISVQKLPNGDTEIGIHIADVSHYVQLKSQIDTEALERGTSVYLVDRTIPMLPRALSDDLCSLLPHVDRLTMSAVITFDKNDVEKDAWFGPTVIHSAHRFTYENAQEVLDGADHQFKDELLTAARIARGLGKGRVDKGALVLDQEEVKILIDEKGRPTQIKKKVRTESHTLIEELMLLANRRIAEFLERGGKAGAPKSDKKKNDESGYAVIYRTHEEPSTEKADDLAFFMRSIGHPIPLRKDGSLDPRVISKVVREFDHGDLKQTALSFIIRSMSKAIYTTKNTGHYGLQFEHYTHFTSPIRRYPDLVIHRLLRYAIAGKPAPAGARKSYERIARLSSMAEVRAADAERESVKFKLTEYMAERIGTVITGMITGVTEWGMYVRDKETTAEGLVGLRSMGTEAFTVNPRLATLTGEISKKTYRIGDTIKVKVVKADPERRQIDYEIVQG